jgi:hypothetical protein
LSSFHNQNEPNAINQNRPIDILDHKYGRGKHLSGNLLEELALEIYNKNGRGTTYKDLMEKFQCTKKKAQRRLKNACREHVNDGKKRSVLFRLEDERTNPQQYFPSCIKAKIIKNKRNRLISTTGDSYSNKGHSSSHSPLHNANENQIVQSFLLQLSLLPWQALNMHNIHLWTIIDKSHYEEINQKPAFNKAKIVRERIGLREVTYKFNKRGSIEIDISSSNNPFQIETDDDVNNFFVFLGKVQYTLAFLLSDPRERIVPQIDYWILKSCDFNKDIEIDHTNVGQLLDLNIQIKHAGKALRLYVKNLEDSFVLRAERTMKVDRSVFSFMNDSILNPYHLFQKKVDELISIIQKLDEKNITSNHRT